jgi:hypothetical protein
MSEKRFVNYYRCPLDGEEWGRCLVMLLQFPMPAVWDKGHRAVQKLAGCGH